MKQSTKIVEMDTDLQMALRSVCDVALRAGGIEAFPHVRKVVDSVATAPDKKKRRGGKGK